MTGAFIADLPKAELHVHLQGTLEPELMMELAHRNDIAVPWATAEEAAAAYEFTDLQHFLTLYYVGCDVLRTERDFHDLALAYLRRAAEDGVVHSEISFSPQRSLDAGVPLKKQLTGVFAAFDEARSEWGIDAALILDAQRHRSVDDAIGLLDAARPWADRVVGAGLGGAEVGNPPARFVRYFEEARARGYRTTCHAGEEGPAEYVRQAIEACRVDRIDHGVRAVDDPALLEALRQQQIPLTICPLSNVRLHVVESLREHPIRNLLEAGLLVTVNSDDPSYFGGHVGANYLALRDELGFTDTELATLARNSFLGSFAPGGRIRAWISSVDEFLATRPDERPTS